MKNTLLLGGLMCAFTFVSAQAAPVTPAQALMRVQSSSGPQKIMGQQLQTPQYKATVGSLYVFDTGEGFMILPANDEAPALLAYSDDTSFEASGNPGLEYWLDYYNRELSYLASHDGATSCTKSASRPDRSPIEPLTKTRWNQEAPYNDQCPELDGKRSVTGCVATAMAQVMKYHSWPVKGKGTHSYDWKHGGETLSFDYGATTFDWANMTDTYDDKSTPAQREAVSTLMLACGISVDMNYAPGESGASSIVMGMSLIDYFDYDKSLWMPMRDYYGLYEWEDMIYADLAKGLPVLYSGQGTAGGHQFICDGYRSDGYFHFNWGWGGMSNGYFLLTALNPADLGIGGGAGGFNSGQQVALSVMPPVDNSDYTYLVYCTEDFKPAVDVVNSGEVFSCLGGFFNFSMTNLPENAAIGVRIVSADGTYDHFLESHKTANVPPLRGYENEDIRFPELPDGEYVITPAFYDGKKWEDMRAGVSNIGKIYADVQDGVATLSSPEAATVTVSNIEVPQTIYIGRDLPLIFAVENASDAEYVGKVTPVLLDDDGNEVAESQYCPLDVIEATTDKVSDYIANFTATAEADFEPGQYNLVFVDSEGNAVSNPVVVNVAEAPDKTEIKVSDFHLVSADPVTDHSNVTFGMTVDCTEGYFTDNILVAIFHADGGESLTIGSTPMLYIDGGDTENVEAHLDLSSFEPGRYMAIAYHEGRPQTGEVHFELSEQVETGIDSIPDNLDQAPGEQTIYNLQGRKCMAPLQPGIYIINGKKTLVY